ncbi:MAG TPA: sigma 54-interacting transcriptional regulator, partial [Planctomycetota bacterium]|nr:sigma 54-interacting transcriptional regulator [Planctomycetota bacterium]
MKPGTSTAVLAPERIAPGREFAFPARESVHRLRTLREFLFKQGRLKEAARIAQKAAEIEPGRETYWRWGVILREAGRYEKALKVLRDALRFQTGPAYAVAEIHLALAAVWYRLQDYKRLGESLRRAYDARLKPRSDVNLHLVLGQFHVSRGRYREALEVYLQAERHARTSMARGRALVNQGVCKYYLQDFPGAIAALGSAIEIHKRAGHVGELAQARYLLGVFHLDQGQAQRALGMLTRAAETFERAGLPDKLGSALGDASQAAMRLGEWPQSRELLDRALEAARQTSFPRLEIVTLALRATACAMLDDFEQATADLSAAKRRLKGQRDYASTSHLYRAQAKISALFGDWMDVRRWALRAERYAQRQDDPVRVAEFRALRAEAEAALGRRRAALHAKATAERLASLTHHASAAMRKILAAAQRLAKSDLPVLLSGESGVGKTRLAQEMHLASPRSKGPCILVPCEQLSHPASDLSGHVQG